MTQVTSNDFNCRGFWYEVSTSTKAYKILNDGYGERVVRGKFVTLMFSDAITQLKTSYGKGNAECIIRVTLDPKAKVVTLDNHDSAREFLLRNPECDAVYSNHFLTVANKGILLNPIKLARKLVESAIDDELAGGLVPAKGLPFASKRLARRSSELLEPIYRA